MIEDTRNDLLHMKDQLEDHGVKVYRPEMMDYKRSVTHYEHLVSGMHTYSARDLLLSFEDMVIECPTPFASRYREFEAYDVIKQEAMKDGCRWIAAPRARMENAECVNRDGKIKLTERYPIFDAANVMKFEEKIIYLKSSTANYAGAKWLQSLLGTNREVIVWDNIYNFAHIDSTLISLNQDYIMLNANRVKEDQIPDFLKNKKKIWVEDCTPREFYKFPYASKWIGMNVLSINPDTVMVDSIQKNLIQQLKDAKFNVVEVPLRHSRTLGGGHHCVTCDLEREHV